MGVFPICLGRREAFLALALARILVSSLACGHQYPSSVQQGCCLHRLDGRSSRPRCNPESSVGASKLKLTETPPTSPVSHSTRSSAFMSNAAVSLPTERPETIATQVLPSGLVDESDAVSTVRFAVEQHLTHRQHP